MTKRTSAVASFCCAALVAWAIQRGLDADSTQSGVGRAEWILGLPGVIAWLASVSFLVADMFAGGSNEYLPPERTVELAVNLAFYWLAFGVLIGYLVPRAWKGRTPGSAR